MKYSSGFFMKGGVLVASLIWFAYTAYWFVVSFGWVGRLFTYGLLNIPDILGTVGLGFRIGASFTIILVVLNIFGEPKLIGLIRHALFMETLYALSLVTFAIFGIISPLMSLWVSVEVGNSVASSDVIVLFLGTGIPYLVQAILIPFALLKLRSKLASSQSPSVESVKWSCVVGFLYILFFWINYSMQWIMVLSGLTVPPTPARGISYVMDYPVNMLSFLLTLVGLASLLAFHLWTALPTIRKGEKPDLKRVGVTLTGLGGYFAVQIALYSIFGFVGGDSLWTSIFFKHTVDLWCAGMLAPGIPLMFHKAQHG